jgi:hypothetical protein
MNFFTLASKNDFKVKIYFSNQTNSEYEGIVTTTECQNYNRK